MADLNIGTEQAPLTVPEGSAAALNYQQNISPNRTVDVSLNPSTTTNTNTLSAPPVTNADISSMLNDLVKFQASVSPEQTAAQTNLNNLQTQGEQLSSDVNDQIMRLGVQPGVTTAVASAQQAEASRQGQYRLQTNAIQQSAAARTLTALQTQRANVLQSYQLRLQGTQQQFSNDLAVRGENRADAADKRAQTALDLQMKQFDKQEQAAALKFALDNQITQPFFQVGQGIYNTSTGQVYSDPEDFKKKTGMTLDQAGAKGLIQKNIKTPEQRQLEFQQQQHADELKKGSIQKVGEYYDENTGQMVSQYAFVDQYGKQTPVSGSSGSNSGTPSVTDVLSQMYPDGTKGGQCGDFMHNLVECPPVGDTIQSKQALVNKQGVKADAWRQEGAMIGDVLVENYGQNGHVAVVTAVNPNGTVTVKESNFSQPETVGSRTISVNDPKIYGAIRANLKGSTGPAPVSPTVQAYAQQYASEGKFPAGVPKGLVGQVSQAAKDLPKQAGEIVNAQTNVRPPKDDAKVNALSDLYSTIELAKQLKELDALRTKGVWGGIINNLDSNNKRYNDLRVQITDLLARARTGAAINASEEALYAGMLPGRLSNPLGIGANTQATIENFINNLSSDLGKKSQAQGWAIYGLSKTTVNGQQYTVGDILDNGTRKARVNPDGTLTPL